MDRATYRMDLDSRYADDARDEAIQAEADELAANDARLDEPWRIPGLKLQNFIDRRINEAKHIGAQERRKAMLELGIVEPEQEPQT